MATTVGGAEGLEPSFDEAQNHSDWPQWETTIHSEIKSLNNNETWTVIKCPSGANVVDSCWVLCIKKNAAGEIEKYKACLVANGFTQIYSVDFYEMYAPVARLASFQLLLALAARNNWPTDAFDFNSAYLNSILDDKDEIIYLEQPPHYKTMDHCHYVLKLKKTLYG